MRKFYQTEWQNIPFSSFHSMSSTTLAGPEFYDAFYRGLVGGIAARRCTGALDRMRFGVHGATPVATSW